MVSLVVLSTGDTAEGKTDGDDIVTVSISHLRRMFAKNEESRVGTSLAVQWLRLHCPVHEAQVQFLSREHVLWPKIIIVITIQFWRGRGLHFLCYIKYYKICNT